MEKYFAVALRIILETTRPNAPVTVRAGVRLNRYFLESILTHKTAMD